ncbi:hypothetical protein [Protaetiibacter intestinalis]|uniref:Fimbrial assembly protein n=1 Tax=Protaetiibacter intestinalis TaxID=2419774 RepID=A0A387B903_9MICO|nr:hypothetical protein [Protaetiibacter intestinalis]AYF97576.1 hypothetical protein D7I47_04400 [Protaetiibacter intestinalis]
MTATISEPTTRVRSSASRVAVPIGVAPRVSLMPPEMGERNRQLGIQRSLRFAMLLVLVLVVAGVAGAWYLSFTAANALAAESQRTQLLQAQRLQYADVDQAINEVALGEAGLRVGGSTEIDWQDYMNRVQASLPAGVLIASFNVDAANSTTQYGQSTIPLQGARIATLQFSAQSTTIPEIPDWLNRLSELPGFVDANPNTVAANTDGTAFTASITMHIDAAAYSNRLVESADDAAGADTTTEEAGQ